MKKWKERKKKEKWKRERVEKMKKMKNAEKKSRELKKWKMKKWRTLNFEFEILNIENFSSGMAHCRFWHFFKRQKFQISKKKKKLNFEKPETPCFGRKVAATKSEVGGWLVVGGLSGQNRDLREARIKSLHEMEELKRVQELRIDESSRRGLIENQDTICELTARIQALQNEVSCLNDSRVF